MSKWRTASERYHAEVASWRDVQPTRGSCLFCDWTVEGMAGQTRLAALEHRLEKHPETRNYRRKRIARQLSNFRPPPLYEHERTEIEDERSKRAFLNGIEP